MKFKPGDKVRLVKWEDATDRDFANHNGEMFQYFGTLQTIRSVETNYVTLINACPLNDMRHWAFRFEWVEHAPMAYKNMKEKRAMGLAE